MPDPVHFNASVDYTAYEPDEDRCHPEGTGGASGGARGTEGAGGTPNAPTTSEETRNCTTELLKTVASCGATVLASRVLTPLATLGIINCAANAAELIECLAEPEPKVSGQ